MKSIPVLLALTVVTLTEAHARDDVPTNYEVEEAIRQEFPGWDIFDLNTRELMRQKYLRKITAANEGVAPPLDPAWDRRDFTSACGFRRCSNVNAVPSSAADAGAAAGGQAAGGSQNAVGSQIGDGTRKGAEQIGSTLGERERAQGQEPPPGAERDRKMSPAEEKLVGILTDTTKRIGDAVYARALGDLLNMDPARASQLMALAAQANGGRPPNLPPSFMNEWSKRFPQSPEPDSTRGSSQLQNGDFKGSRDSFDSAIKKGGETSQNYLGRGLASEGMGDYRQAAQDAAKALQLEPGNLNADALLKLSQARVPSLKLNAKGLSTPDFDSGAVAGGPGGQAQRGGAAGSPPRQSAAPPAAYPGSRASLGGLDSSNHFARDAQRAFQAGDYRGSIVSADRALGQFSRNLQALNLRAMAKEKLGDRKGAVADATAGLGLSPGNAGLLTTRSWARSGMGEHEAAEADAKAALQAEPDNAFALASLARAQGGQGRRADMLAALKRAAGLDARFEKTLEAAVKLPEKGDTELLFAGLGQPKTAESSRPRRFATVLLLALVGGLLIAGGLLSVLSPTVRKTITQAWRINLGEAMGQPAEPTGKFWEYYTFKRELGKGGMGVVYEAVDESLGRRVAVKQMRGEIRDDPTERGWFIKEARVVAQLHHPNLVEIYSIIEDESELYLVFEYVEGKTLDKLLAEKGRLSVDEATQVVKGVCAGVQHAHDKGIIHQDLKPSNVIIDAQGTAKVMDFGIARHAQADGKTMKLTANIVGTPPYMAPEAEEGAAQKTSDVFSIGVCLYELLTGEAPFQGPQPVMHAAKLAGKYTAPSRALPTLPKALDEIVAKALSPVASARYATPALLAGELERVALRSA